LIGLLVFGFDGRLPYPLHIPPSSSYDVPSVLESLTVSCPVAITRRAGISCLLAHLIIVHSACLAICSSLLSSLIPLLSHQFQIDLML
jgi:hypothetical protein